MKKLFLLLLLTIIPRNAFAQEFYLKILGQNERENQIIDSIGYQPTHQNTKSIFDENSLFSEKLNKKGYLENQISENFKLNDSTFCFKYNLRQKTNLLHIYIDKNNQNDIPDFYIVKNDTLTIKFEQTESFLNNTLKNMENKGFAMCKVKLINFQKRNHSLSAELNINKEIKRQLNDIIIIGYDKFPEGHKKNILKKYRKNDFNQKNLNKLYSDFEKLRFIKQNKYPEVLFTKDSTKAFIYLEKAKTNTFDGFIGFSNNETKKLILSGYLDLKLNNILNSGEKFSLYWKSDGQDQKTFDLNIETPFIFKSPLGLKAQLNIFKQDSTYQNTKTAIDLGYYFNYNKKIFLGYQSTESSDIQNINTANLTDYNNAFFTTEFEFSDFKTDDFLFPEKTFLDIKIGTGKRETITFSDNQFFGSLLFKHNFYLNKKNIIHLKTQNFYLQSNHYITNELERFGGINSIRGFNENSLQGNLFSSLQNEYRYLLTSNLYVHSIIDYGFIQDKTSDYQNNLLGLGFGFGLLTNNGLFNIVYANGSTGNQSVKLSNSVVHISFKANF